MRSVYFAIVGMAAALGLTACNEETAKTPEVQEAPARLAGVRLDQSLRGLGNEPFWSVVIEGDNIGFSTMEGESLHISHDGPVVTDNVAMWRGTTTDGRAMVMTLGGVDCSDGMSDRVYPLTLSMVLGDVEYNGCAASSEAMARVGERGRVE